MSPEQEAVLQAALGYVNLGWRIVPIAERSKKPQARLLPRRRGRSPSWARLVEAPPTRETVAGWFEVEPSINIAIATGVCSGIAVVDFDTTLSPEVRALLDGLGGPIVRTARGIHAYHAISEPTKSHTLTGETVVFEVRCDGNYVVAPPSLHKSGKRYEWLVPLNGNLPSLSSFFDGLAATGMTLFEAPPAPKLAAIVGAPMGTPVEATELPSGANALLGSRPTAYADGGADWFREIAQHKELSFLQARRMGVLSSALGVGVACPLHPETHPSAAVWPGDNGEIVFHDFHLQGSTLEFMTLPELRWSLAIGEPTKLKKTSMPFWRLLSMYEAGLLTPAHVDLAVHVLGADPDALRVAEAFRLALGLHWLMEPGKEFAFAARLAAALTGLPLPRAHRAIQALRGLGVIQPAGTCRSGYGNPTYLYLPGEGR